MASTLYEDVLAGNAGWPFEWNGEAISEADEARMVAAATELVEEFERRGEAA